MGSLILKAALTYIESHPQFIEQIVEWAFDEIAKHVQSQKSA
jgi:hypothetical protein